LSNESERQFFHSPDRAALDFIDQVIDERDQENKSGSAGKVNQEFFQPVPTGTAGFTEAGTLTGRVVHQNNSPDLL
jgi:hypothetical protein